MRVRGIFASGGAALLIVTGCTATPPSSSADVPMLGESVSEPVTAERATSVESSRIIGVEATANDRGYSFAVTVESDETGCDRYANWWEVITPEGELLYRRILAHSHVNEQPFTRSGGPVMVGEEVVVVVRSHTNTDGYGTQAMKGSVSEGFSPTILSEDFAVELAEAEPQPGGCAF